MIIILRVVLHCKIKKKLLKEQPVQVVQLSEALQVQSEVGVLNEGGSLLLGITGVMVSEASC